MPGRYIRRCCRVSRTELCAHASASLGGGASGPLRRADSPVHDDAKVVERPGVVVVLDVRAEEAELESGDPERPPDVQEIKLVAIGHARLLALRLDVESLGEEKRGPQPGNV